MSAGIFLLQRAELCRKHAEHDFRVHLRAKALDGGFGQPQGTLGGNALHRCVGALPQARSGHRAEVRQQGGGTGLVLFVGGPAAGKGRCRP